MGKNFFDKYFSKAGVALFFNLCAAAAILPCQTAFGSGPTERGATEAASMEVKSEKTTGGAEGRGAGEPSKSAQSRGNAAQMSGSKAVQKKSAAKNLGKENRQASGALKEGTDSAAKKGKNLNRLSEKKKVVRPAKKSAPQAAPVREPTAQSESRQK